MAHFSIWAQLPAEGPSAFCGQPPNTQADLHIIKGFFRIFDVPETVSPAMVWHPAPPGYVRNEKQASIIAGMAVSMVIIFGITTARILARICGEHTVFGLDDYAIIPAAALALLYPVLQLLAVVKGGGGRHSWDNTYENISQFFFYLDTCTKVYYADMALLKISITIFVRRLANHASSRWRIAADVYIITVVGHLIAGVLVNSLRCDPPRAGWDMEFSGSLEPPARCHEFHPIFITLHTVHVVQSMTLLMAPVVILWKVQMDTGKKIRLFVIWLVGALSVLGGLLQYLLAPVGEYDIFMAYTTTLQWTMLDLTMGVIAASLPVLDSVLIGGWRRATSRIVKLCRKSSSSRLGTGDPGTSSRTSGARSQDRTAIGGSTSNLALGQSRPALSSIRDQFDSTEAKMPPVRAARLTTDEQYGPYEMPNLSPRATADTGVDLGEPSRKENEEV
ncbi:hypothetical protein PpBr36_07326 [Pyricularia pennisetigena]|uniref:hypothetical protein n=1 Tax=Pyricularia pennisetigena TaxID=1578925 RepID=UPI0011500A26|nr:hypothetical protein PpBr36_07326 [Pyricularia pennisetigena]TLS25319.1 hypothetical protein PpBr36_07326 [Pyricularia pennisetigena]